MFLNDEQNQIRHHIINIIAALFYQQRSFQSVFRNKQPKAVLDELISGQNKRFFRVSHLFQFFGTFSGGRDCLVQANSHFINDKIDVVLPWWLHCPSSITPNRKLLSNNETMPILSVFFVEFVTNFHCHVYRTILILLEPKITLILPFLISIFSKFIINCIQPEQLNLNFMDQFNKKKSKKYFILFNWEDIT